MTNITAHINAVAAATNAIEPIITHAPADNRAVSVLAPTMMSKRWIDIVQYIFAHARDSDVNLIVPYDDNWAGAGVFVHLAPLYPAVVTLITPNDWLPARHHNTSSLDWRPHPSSHHRQHLYTYATEPVRRSVILFDTWHATAEYARNMCRAEGFPYAAIPVLTMTRLSPPPPDDTTPPRLF